MNRTTERLIEQPRQNGRIADDRVTPEVPAASLPIDGVAFYEKMKKRADFRDIMERLAK